MKTAIDRAGRLVVPKAIRRAAQIEPGQELDIAFVDGRIEIDIPATPMALVETSDGIEARAEIPMPELTAEQVRDVLEQVRR